MRSIISIAILTVLALALTACAYAAPEVAEDTAAPAEAEHTFKAYVSAVYENQAEVIVAEDDVTFAPGSIVFVNYENSNDLEAGDLVEFTFTGQVMLSEPAQVIATGWNVLEKGATVPEANMGPAAYSGETVFKGTILEINGDSVLVQVTEGEEMLASSDKVTFSTEGLADIGAHVGTEVVVTITGDILESYPAQVNPFSWELA